MLWQKLESGPNLKSCAKGNTPQQKKEEEKNVLNSSQTGQEFVYIFYHFFF